MQRKPNSKQAYVHTANRPSNDKNELWMQSTSDVSVWARSRVCMPVGRDTTPSSLPHARAPKRRRDTESGKRNANRSVSTYRRAQFRAHYLFGTSDVPAPIQSLSMRARVCNSDEDPFMHHHNNTVDRRRWTNAIVSVAWLSPLFNHNC